MVTINLQDKNFIGDSSSCHMQISDLVRWERGNVRVSKSCFITDFCLVDVKRLRGAQRKIAWILEPKSLIPEIYDWIIHNNKEFDFVITHDLDITDRGENYLYGVWGGTWITNYVEQKKNKNISIIASSKNHTYGHHLRHSVISAIRDIDVYGRGYRPVAYKEEALSTYKFSIVIENSVQRGYWTEKIVDCFNTKTIPIYWGTESVVDYFNKDGIIFFNTIQELQNILLELNHNSDFIYASKSSAIEENFLKAKEFKTTEDWLYKTYNFLFN
jgi:hypothetical protein